MTYTRPISKRGTLTLPPELRRRLKLDQVASPLVIVEERDGKKRRVAAFLIGNAT